ncbi:MAG TPA: hypothetical protein VH083_25790 [Myxococcales bacterium]|jgi:hypothetical protein|nr:hypothetical protein [Myxococcales bacterium]
MTRVSLARPLQETLLPAPPLLDPAGARVILGGAPAADGLAQSIVPSAGALFGPRGACLSGADGPLFVCDTGHHRLLVWRRAPSEACEADLIFGQPDFASEGRNARGAVSGATLNVPTGIACENGVVAVADAWNHRVLLWHDGLQHSHQPPDVVLGQIDRAAGLANRGRRAPRADTLNWCYGVALHQGRLFIADTGNRRVLVFDQLPERDGAAADLVLGEKDFTTRDDNASGPAGPAGMRWPHGMAFVDGAFLVADAGDNRVMVWRKLPTENGAPCDFVLGQRDLVSVDHNQASYLPTSTTLSMPYGLALLQQRLVVADTANSRLLGFEKLSANAAATRLCGQTSFGDKGDNRWGFARSDSLCWPYAVSACGSTLVIADSGNNRVLLWEMAP